MKVTYRQLVDSVPSFQELVELKFPPKLSQKLSEFVSSVDEHLQIFDEKVEDITEQFSEEDRVNAVEELLNATVEITIPDFAKSSITQPVSPRVFTQLSWFFSPEKTFLKTTPKDIL